MKNNQLRKNLLYSILPLLMTLLLINNITNAQEAKEDASEQDKNATMQDIQGWRIKDYKPYVQAMKDIFNRY